MFELTQHRTHQARRSPVPAASCLRQLPHHHLIEIVVVHIFDDLRPARRLPPARGSCRWAASASGALREIVPTRYISSCVGSSMFTSDWEQSRIIFSSTIAFSSARTDFSCLHPDGAPSSDRPSRPLKRQQRQPPSLLFTVPSSAPPISLSIRFLSRPVCTNHSTKTDIQTPITARPATGHSWHAPCGRLSFLPPLGAQLQPSRTMAMQADTTGACHASRSSKRAIIRQSRRTCQMRTLTGSSIPDAGILRQLR